MSLTWRFFLILSILVTLGAGAQEPVESPDADAPFRVALTGKYPPFSFYSNTGELQGFDVDVSREIAGHLDREVEIITTDWAGIIAGLQSGRYDAIIGSMAITPERQKAVIFSRPYYVSGAQLFVRSEESDDIQSIEDIAEEAVGVTVGTTYEQFLTENYPDMDVRTYTAEADIFQDMETGRLSGFVTDKLVGMYNAKKAGVDFVPAGPLLYQERMGIPVTFENADLVEQINAALDSMERQGQLDELHEKWFALEPEQAEVSSSVIWGKLLRGFLVTLEIAALSIILGFILAIPIGVGIKSGPKPVRMFLVGASDFIRGTPVLVQLFFVFYGLGRIEWLQMTPFAAGVLTLTMNAAAYMGEVVRAGLMSVPNGQTIGALALGLSKVQAFRYIVWPQAFRIMVPPLMNSVVALLKDTALVSVISVAEVVTETHKLVAITYKPMMLWALVALLFFIVSFPLMKAAQRLEERMRRRGFATEN